MERLGQGAAINREVTQALAQGVTTNVREYTKEVAKTAAVVAVGTAVTAGVIATGGTALPVVLAAGAAGGVASQGTSDVLEGRKPSASAYVGSALLGASTAGLFKWGGALEPGFSSFDLGSRIPDSSLYARPSHFRVGTIRGAVREAPVNEVGEMICQTCGEVIPDTITVQTVKGPVTQRGYHIDHYPEAWWERILALKARPMPPTRQEVLDMYNRDVRVLCPTCNVSHKFEGVPGQFQ